MKFIDLDEVFHINSRRSSGMGCSTGTICSSGTILSPPNGGILSYRIDNKKNEQQVKPTFLVESGQTSNQWVEASIKNIKYLNGQLGGFIGPQMSPYIICIKDGDSYASLAKEGRVINFPRDT